MGETRILVMKDGTVSREKVTVGSLHRVTWLPEVTGTIITVSFTKCAVPFTDWDPADPVKSGTEVSGWTGIQVGTRGLNYKAKSGKSNSGKAKAQDPEIIVDGGGGDPGNPKPGKRRTAKAKKTGAKKR